MTVFNLKGQIVEVGPGVCGSEAEAVVTDRDGRDVFVYTWRFDGCRSYTVSGTSAYGKMTTEEFDEEKCEEYYDVGRMLRIFLFDRSKMWRRGYLRDGVVPRRLIQ